MEKEVLTFILAFNAGLIIGFVIMYWISYIINKANKFEITCDNKKDKEKPKKRKVKLKEFKEEFDDFKNDVIGKLQDNDKFNDNLAKRDMLVRTNFLGKLKNKELINSFKTLTRFRNKNPYACAFDMIEFEDVKQMVTDYDFEYLDDFLDMLKEYEDKQEVLDNYREKK